MTKHLVSGHNVASRKRAYSLSMGKQQTHYKGYFQILIANDTRTCARIRMEPERLNPTNYMGWC
jgi:hypothetical protein